MLVCLETPVLRFALLPYYWRYEEHLRSLSYKNIRDSDSPEKCVEICAHQDDWNLILDGSEISNLSVENIVYVSFNWENKRQ